MKEKEYLIKSLHDLCNLVNSENAQRLATDTAQWLISYQHSIELIRNRYPKETKGKSNTEIAKGSFSWIDDGKNDLKKTIVTIAKLTSKSGNHRWKDHGRNRKKCMKCGCLKDTTASQSFHTYLPKGGEWSFLRPACDG